MCQGAGSIVKATALAAAKGTRLFPLTGEMPKPVVPALDKPIVQHGCDLLATQGERDQRPPSGGRNPRLIRRGIQRRRHDGQLLSRGGTHGPGRWRNAPRRHNLAYTGIYVLEPEVLEYVPENRSSTLFGTYPPPTLATGAKLTAARGPSTDRTSAPWKPTGPPSKRSSRGGYGSTSRALPSTHASREPCGIAAVRGLHPTVTHLAGCGWGRTRL